ncbi:tetratricopeptide repeat protein, partial [bacterium AH-315-I20]|nr:tetratricopeptide repeat protein [bacterium AH-315-I20]
MLDPKTQHIKNTLLVHREKIIIDVSELSDEQLVFELNPVEELQDNVEIEVKGSIGQAVQSDSVGLKGFLNGKLGELKDKFNHFEHSSTYLSHLSALSELLGDVKGSKHFLEKALSVGGDKNLFGNKLGKNLLLNNQAEEATDIFRGLDLTVNVEANLNLGYLAVLSSQFDAASRYVGKALSIDAAHYGTRVFAGGLSIYKGEYETAIRHFRVALSEKPNSSTAYVNLAAAYSCLGHSNKAISSLKKAVTIDPLNRNAVIFLADLLFQEKKNGLVIEPLLYFIKYNGESVVAWERLGRACYFSGQYDKTINALIKQAEITGYNSSIWNNLGLAYWKSKKHEKASTFFRNALKAHGDNGCSPDIALSNYCWFLIEHRKYGEIIQLTNQVLESIESKSVKTKHEEFILLQHCVALEGNKQFQKAFQKLN